MGGISTIVGTVTNILTHKKDVSLRLRAFRQAKRTDGLNDCGRHVWNAMENFITEHNASPADLVEAAEKYENIKDFIKTLLGREEDRQAFNLLIIFYSMGLERRLKTSHKHLRRLVY